MARGLPGVSFELQAPALDRVLPRMDVAAFVGFARSGPVDVPVPVENTGQFEAIFGDDVTLPTGERSELGAAVRAFFAGGGLRCHVVRVAEDAAANRFRLDGLVRWDGSAARPAFAVARSRGSWSDALRVRAVPTERPLRAKLVLEDGVPIARAAGADGVRPGDLLRVRKRNRTRFVPVLDLVGPRGDALLGPAIELRPVEAVALGADDVGDTLYALGIDLEVHVGDGRVRALRGLGLHPLHPRYWRRLPDDEALFRSPDWRGLWGEAADLRYDLAGEPAGGPGWEIPTDPTPAWTTAEPSARSPLSRDGLATSRAERFVDAALVGHTTGALLSVADWLRWTGPAPRPLRGVHALLGSEEVTLVALPDLHRAGWNAPPEADAITTDQLPLPPRQDGFVACEPCGPLAPAWLPLDVDPAPAARWQARGDGKGVEWRLEADTDPAFPDPSVLADGLGSRVELPPLPSGDHFLRVRGRKDGCDGPWSATLRVRVPPPARARPLDPADRRRDADAVQRVLLRMCAARGDLFAVLSRPPEDPIERVAEGVGALRAIGMPASGIPLGTGLVLPWGADERATLSFGGVWHPWALLRDRDGELRVHPPDGLVTAMLSRRASRDGAWMAPANLPIGDVLSLIPSESSEAWSLTAEARINLLQRTPQGCRVLDEWTLDGDGDVGAVHVRRLLSLLRRLALREGNALVFEPNSPAFRRSVISVFDRLLAKMHDRGAFAGRAREESYRITVADGAAQAEAGRVVVELRVAPAHPMRFLVVRLVNGDGSVAVQGA
jgi:hypothetical protein